MNLITLVATKLTTNKKDLIPNHLPKQLESVVRAETFSKERHRWNTNEEVASLLIAFDKHEEWQDKDIFLRPPSGTMLLYNRKVVRYRKDGYCWKKRKDGKTTREDHMKLKVQGSECIYGCYVHSSILPTFHRRCYWLLQNPDIVLVHYLNVPLTRNNQVCCLPPISFECEGWSKEELESQIRPMFASLKHFSEDLTETSIQSLVDLLSMKNFDSGNRGSSCSSCHLLPISSPTLRLAQKQQNHTVLPLVTDKQQIDAFSTNEDWGCLFNSSREDLPMGSCFNSDCMDKVEGVGGVLDPFSSIESPGRPLDINIFSLNDFPTCFDNTESDASQVKTKATYRPICCLGERIPNEMESTLMDDLDDILNIVSASTNEDLDNSDNTLRSRSIATEFSPEWSYSKGGEKMLITGEFNSYLDYVVHFGEVQVCGKVIRNGVLKCTIPAHKEGNVDLKVLQGELVVALCGIFMYKSEHRTTFDVQASDLEGMLWNRMLQLRNCLTLERDIKVLDHLIKLASEIFLHSNYDRNQNSNHLSLLHLASALGNSQMITLLLEIRNEENVSGAIMSEVDPLSEDIDGNIPITWACARGNLEAFVILFQFCPHSMSFANNNGCSPTHFIQQIGKSFFEPSLLALKLTRGEKSRDKETQTMNMYGVPNIAHDSISNLDSRWPTDNDPCLPYRRSVQGQRAPTLFGASRAKEFFKGQCKKEIFSVKRTSLELGKVSHGISKLHNRSESLNEEFLDFWANSGMKFRCSNSEPQLNESNLFSKTVTSSSIRNDAFDNCFLFSNIDMVDVEDDLMSTDNMVSLANQIIAAIPERIKSHTQDSLADGEDEEEQETYSYDQLGLSLTSSVRLGNTRDSGIGTPMEGIPSSQEYRSGSTPSSTLSPTSTYMTILQHLDSPTTAADFTQYFNAPATYMEEDFSLLTLSDEEQRKVYQAAKIIQNFYRRYKDKKSTGRQKEVDAAIIIQNCFRRYKQFLYYKRMNQAAVLIQSRFRSYYAQKRYRRSREAAKIIQNRYRAYKEHEKFKRSKNTTIASQQRFRGHYQVNNINRPSLANSVQKMLEEHNGFSQKDTSMLDRSKSSNSVKGINEAS